MTEDKFEFREGKVFCKCGWEMIPDSESRQYSGRMRCENPECEVWNVIHVRPRHHEKGHSFRDLKTCAVTT